MLYYFPLPGETTRFHDCLSFTRKYFVRKIGQVLVVLKPSGSFTYMVSQYLKFTGQLFQSDFGFEHVRHNSEYYRQEFVPRF